MGRGGRVLFDRCSAAVTGMHNAFSQSGGSYGGGANRADGMSEYSTLDRPGDRASAIWKHMCARDKERERSTAGSGKEARRCDWNYLGGMAMEESCGRGSVGGLSNGVHSTSGGAAGGDWRKRSLSQISGIWGMATGPYIYRGGYGAIARESAKSNSCDSSVRPETAAFIKKARWADRRPKLDDNGEKALSEASTSLA